MSTEHCFQGAAGDAQYTPTGRCSIFAGLEIYTSTPQDNASSADLKGRILYLPDGFGLARHNKRLADLYAQRGYETTVVDYFEGDALPEVFMQYVPGTDIDAYDNFTPEEKETIRQIDMPAWLARHGVAHMGAIVDQFFKEYCARISPGEPSQLGNVHILGHCFGGKYAFRLAQLGGSCISTVLVYHPAFLEPSDLEGLQKPTLVGVAETDMFTPDLTRTLVGKLPECGTTWKLLVYGGTKHGFASRADLGDKVAARMFQEAFDDGVRWMELSKLD